MLKTKTILGVPITVSSKAEILSFLQTNFKKKKQTLIFTPNPEIVVEASNDSMLLKILKKSDINIPDGKGIGLALSVSVITGREFVLDLFSLLEREGGSVFVLAGSTETISKTISQAKKDYPKLNLSGLMGPILDKEGIPVDSKNEAVQKNVLEKIKKQKPTLVVVGFGAPKQEKWIEANAHSLPSTSFMSAGGSFDYYAGLKRLPPTWMGNLGLEWLWRLFQESGHFERVIRALIVFPVLVLLRHDKK